MVPPISPHLKDINIFEWLLLPFELREYINIRPNFPSPVNGYQAPNTRTYHPIGLLRTTQSHAYCKGLPSYFPHCPCKQHSYWDNGLKDMYSVGIEGFNCWVGFYDDGSCNGQLLGSTSGQKDICLRLGRAFRSVAVSCD